jgi:hypothetical protein
MLLIIGRAERLFVAGAQATSLVIMYSAVHNWFPVFARCQSLPRSNPLSNGLRYMTMAIEPSIEFTANQRSTSFAYVLP